MSPMKLLFHGVEASDLQPEHSGGQGSSLGMLLEHHDKELCT